MNKKIILIISILFVTCSLANAGNSPIFSAAQQGDTEEIRKLLEEGINVDFKNDLGCTALMLAADNGKLEAVKLLVKHKADINARNNDGDTPLIRAANNGHFDVVRFLVEKGADTNAYRDNNKKATAYTYAKQNGHYQIANYLESRTSTASSTGSSSYVDFVIVQPEIADAFLCSIKEFSLDNLNGRIDRESAGSLSEKTAKGTLPSLNIHKGLNSGLAGQYRWSAKFDCGNRYCGGTIFVSGTKQHHRIYFDKDCGRLRSNEF